MDRFIRKDEKGLDKLLKLVYSAYRGDRNVKHGRSWNESLIGLSAGIRSLRKPENGNRTVDKRKREDSNEFKYRLVRGI